MPRRQLRLQRPLRHALPRQLSFQRLRLQRADASPPLSRDARRFRLPTP